MTSKSMKPTVLCGWKTRGALGSNSHIIARKSPIDRRQTRSMVFLRVNKGRIRANIKWGSRFKMFRRKVMMKMIRMFILNLGCRKKFNCQKNCSKNPLRSKMS